MTIRAKGLEEWGKVEVNCLLKAVAIARGWVRVVELKEIGWLEEGRGGSDVAALGECLEWFEEKCCVVYV